MHAQEHLKVSSGLDSETKIFLSTLLANLIFFGTTLLIFKKVRYWRDDDQN